MLNTLWHTKEEIEKAEKIVKDKIKFDVGTSDREIEAYESILIFCNFNEGLASHYYEKLRKNGILLYSDVVYGGSNLIGWTLD